MEILGGRKTVVSIVTLAVGVAVTYIKGDVPPNLLQLLEVIGAGYILGNVGVKVFGKNFGPEEETPASPRPIVNEVITEGVPQEVVIPDPVPKNDEVDTRIQAVNNRIVIAEQKVATLEQTVSSIATIILKGANNGTTSSR